MGVSVHDGHAPILFVKRDARIEVAHAQRDMGQSQVRPFLLSLIGGAISFSAELYAPQNS